MADSKTMIVPATDTPTFWNKDMAAGFFWGLLVRVGVLLAAGVLAAAGILTSTAILGGIAFASNAIPLIGIIKGSLDGKERMQNESINGKVVSEPTFWNKSIFVGALIPILIANVATIGLAAAGLVVSPVLAVAGMATVVLGGIIGGAVGKSQQQEEYAQAQAYVAQYGNFSPNRSPAREQTQERAYTITPQEAQQLEAKLAAGKRPHADALMDQPQIAQAR